MRAPGQRLRRAVLLPQRHQARHLVLGQLDLFAAPVGQLHVSDLVGQTGLDLRHGYTPCEGDASGGARIGQRAFCATILVSASRLVECGVRGRTKDRIRSGSLTPGPDFDAARRVDPMGSHGSDRRGDVFRLQPTCQDQTGASRQRRICGRQPPNRRPAQCRQIGRRRRRPTAPAAAGKPARGTSSRWRTEVGSPCGALRTACMTGVSPSSAVSSATSCGDSLPLSCTRSSSSSARDFGDHARCDIRRTRRPPAIRPRTASRISPPGSRSTNARAAPDRNSARSQSAPASAADRGVVDVRDAADLGAKHGGVAVQ